MLDRAMASALLESGTAESPTDPLTITNFMKFVCGHDTCTSAMAAKSSGELLLRPYELFLYAHQRDLETQKLTKRRKTLEQDFVPQPEYSSSLSIMVAHGGAEEILEKWDKEDNERSHQIQLLENQTEEKLALERLGEVGQQQAALQEVGIKPPGKKAAQTAATKKKDQLKKKGVQQKRWT